MSILSDSATKRNAIIGWEKGPNGTFKAQMAQVASPGLTFGKAAVGYGNAAENALQQMISSAQSAVSQAGANATTPGAIGNIQGAAGDVRNTAGLIGAQASAVNDFAKQVGQTANGLTPYAQSMKDYAQQIYGNGQNLVDQGKALLGSWGQFAPLLEKYTGALGQLDPSNQVSLAASDVQKSYQDVQGQNARTLARMGVDPSSGAYQRQKQQWDQALATALAGAKTRSRNSGLQEQIAQLAQGLNLGGNLAQTGAGIAGQGAGEMVNGANVLGNAAGIVQAQGQLQEGAGQLAQGAGGLYGSQANAQQAAGQLDQAAATLAMNFDGQQLDAQQFLISVMNNAVQYYSQQAAGLAQAAGSNFVVSSLFL